MEPRRQAMGVAATAIPSTSDADGRPVASAPAFRLWPSDLKFGLPAVGLPERSPQSVRSGSIASLPKST